MKRLCCWVELRLQVMKKLKLKIEGCSFDDMYFVLQIRNHGEIITCTSRGDILSRKRKTLTTSLIPLLVITVCALRCIEVVEKVKVHPLWQATPMVQRSVEDQSVLVATYEGEHNHPMPSQMDSNNGLNRYISHGGSASTPVAANKRSSLTEPTDRPLIVYSMKKRREARATEMADEEHVSGS
ncbi:WRKY family transcription factor [Arabidopsis thaliana]|uniref:WRKY family transcription factor n=1 Tax=Arabidopsis thaliana TaxID=3702 RepID=F4JA74_ARATH|nr:WRKY family transcription factor [Arabidopsis thaliana]AEE77685.1 WRKY family transcription factor [Arabidopsis thaliana]|eukprot:NP_189752.1 WRKY family transcription factor [Arabidopsis thaliana]